MIKPRRHRYLAPEPVDAGGGGQADPDPAAAADQSPENQAPADQAQAEAASTDDKIGALLDNIGKDEEGGDDRPAGEKKPEDTAAAKPAAGEVKPAQDQVAAGKDQPKDGAKDEGKSGAKAFDLTPPEGMKDGAKARWAELADRAKQVPALEQRATEAETALAGVREMVRQSGLQQDEFAGMLEMGRLFKSADPKDLQTALAQLDTLRTDLATRLGVDAPGADPLAKHQDLQDEVTAMTITRERALEIAKLRDGQSRVDAQRRAQDQDAQFRSTVQSAAREMETALSQRSATPGHAAKVEFIKQQLSDPARMQQFVTTYQPNQWQAAVLMMYDAYTPPAAPPTPAAPQPLRPGHVANGVRQIGNKPVSSSAAVEAAFDSIGL